MRPPSLTSWPEQRRRSGGRGKTLSNLRPNHAPAHGQSVCVRMWAHRAREESDCSLLPTLTCSAGECCHCRPYPPPAPGPHSPLSSPWVMLKARTKFSGRSRLGGCSPSWEKHWARAVPPSRCCPGLRGTYSRRPRGTGEGEGRWMAHEHPSSNRCWDTQTQSQKAPQPSRHGAGRGKGWLAFTMETQTKDQAPNTQCREEGKNPYLSLQDT